MNYLELKNWLEYHANLYENPQFIENDPVQIPAGFIKKEDAEISGFFAALFAWGNRKAIINKTRDLLARMDNEPYDFIISATKNDLRALAGFKHRTFNEQDAVFMVMALRNIYQHCGGLETVMCSKDTVANGIESLRNIFFQHQTECRTRKHMSSPAAGSAAKRLCMYFRWMVRPSERGVDLGLWNFPLASLMCPLDVHSGNTARKLGILVRKQNDWIAVEELTAKLRTFNENDPVRYDFALFGAGVSNVIFDV
jgi:uncharacterized protein (TIGR02757 family)